MADARVIDVHDFLNNQRFSLFHLMLMILCFFVVALDGFDTGALGYIAPTLAQTWQIPRDALGPVLSAALVGLGIGAIIGGPIADRIGRKVVLIVSVIFFGVWSIASAYATSIESLTVLRLLTGLGLGAAVPNAVTMTSEYAPERIRGIIVNTMFVGFAVGLASGGVTSAYLIPHFGWQSVLLLGGVAPVLLSIALAIWLPESARFLIARRRSSENIARILKRLAPHAVFDGVVFSSQRIQAARHNPVFELFSRRYILGTLMLWLSYIMCLAVFYLLTNWMPMLFKASGFSLHQSVITTSMLHWGGCLGMLIAGWFMDRFQPFKVVSFFCILTAVMVVIVGRNVGHPSLMSVLLFITGVAMSGAAGSIAPLAAEYYPTAIRATGVAWVLALGRLGAIGGAFGGAVLVGLGWQLGAIFSLLAVPLGMTALTLLVVMFDSTRHRTGQGQAIPQSMTELL
ncbi:4-hydroxybenzoate transporter [Burkholderia territorii]|nr:4-hydroxybenzoate transporter [Burkholderia territorii]KWA30897.1 4-hydroxybenzoate transporter [Burkholderia territorii]